MKTVKVIIDCKMLDEYRYLQFFSKDKSTLKYLFRERMPKRKTMELSVDLPDEETLVVTFEHQAQKTIGAFCARNVMGTFFALLPRANRFFCFVNTCYQWSLRTEIECEENDIVKLKYIASTDIREPVEALISAEGQEATGVKLSSENLDVKNDYKRFNLGLFFSFLLEIIMCGIIWVINQVDWLERFSLVFWITLIFSVIYFLRVMLGSYKEYKLLKCNNYDLSIFISRKQI